jgi:hypothetical protein
MGLNPQIWGRQGWHFIHSVALSYPITPTDEEKENYKKFLFSLPDTLPCSICGEHFKENLEKFPPKLDSREDFWKWSVDVHNEVNKSNDKPTLSYDEAYKEFENNYQKNFDADNKPTQEVSFVELFAGISFTFIIINLLNK